MSKIEIDGGHGYLRNMTLYADGRLLWHGWEPGRRTASQLMLKLPADDIRKIWNLAENAHVHDLAGPFKGSGPSHRVHFVFGNARKTIEITHEAIDQCPASLNALLEALWETRRRSYPPEQVLMDLESGKTLADFQKEKGVGGQKGGR